MLYLIFMNGSLRCLFPFVIHNVKVLKLAQFYSPLFHGDSYANKQKTQRDKNYSKLQSKT